MTNQETVAGPVVLPAPLEAHVLTVKLRLEGREKHEFIAAARFYGTSEKKLARAAVRHFLAGLRGNLPAVDLT